MKKITILFILILIVSTIGFPQTNYWWRSEASNGNWNVTDNWWNGSMNQIPQGSDVIKFDNNVELTMTNNLTAANRYRIYFDATATSSRTIGGSTENIFYDYGGNKPGIENNSSANHTINFPIKLGYNPLELRPINGNLTIGGNINTDGNYIDVYGSNSKTLTINGVISGTGGFTIKQNSTVVFTNSNMTYTGTTVLENGVLELGVNLSSSSITVNSGATLKIVNNSTINDLTIQSGGVVEIQAGKGLTVSGTLVNNAGTSGLVIYSDATGTGSLITGQAVSITFKRYIAAYLQ